MRAAIHTGDFRIISSGEYTNEFGQPGIEYVCDYRGRRFYVSENRTEQASTVQHFARVLKDQNEIDARKPLIWPNRFGEDCLYLEVWSYGRWYKFHTPMKNAPADEFGTLITKIVEGC
jgi:hypothetical protein